MSKLNDRLSDLFHESRTQLSHCSVEELTCNLQVFPSMHAEIIRKADQISRGECVSHILATSQAPHRVVSGIYEAFALRLLHVKTAEFEPVMASELQILRCRFDEVSDYSWRSNLIQQYAMTHPDFDRGALAKHLSISSVALCKYLTYLPKD